MRYCPLSILQLKCPVYYCLHFVDLIMRKARRRITIHLFRPKYTHILHHIALHNRSGSSRWQPLVSWRKLANNPEAPTARLLHNKFYFRPKERPHKNRTKVGRHARVAPWIYIAGKQENKSGAEPKVHYLNKVQQLGTRSLHIWL